MYATWFTMQYSALEIVGLTAIIALTTLALKETWKFLYTVYIGHALGRSISLKNIGQWASKSFCYWSFAMSWT